MNSIQDCLFVGLLTLGGLFGCYSAYIVRKYHRSKPMGLQTLLGKVMIIVTTYYSMSSTSIAVIFSLTIVFRPTQFYIPEVMTFSVYVSLMLYFLGFGACLLTRYASVYHSTYVASLDEVQVLRWIKGSILAASILVPIIEYTWITPVNVTVIYNIILDETGSPEQKVERLKNIVGLADVLVMITLQLRLEYDKAHFGDDSCFLELTNRILALISGQPNISDTNGDEGIQNDANDGDDNAGNHRFSRILVILASIFPLTIFYQSLFGFDHPMNGVVLSYLAITVIGPACYILNHDSMKKMFLSSIRLPS